ncbi:MAG: glycosyltransferase family 4 protein, partial [Symploca sp. SIO2D2]|nr:glycosyltransferase family 4 protein [Symploca sp. SIO2D2]
EEGHQFDLVLTGRDTSKISQTTASEENSYVAEINSLYRSLDDSYKERVKAPGFVSSDDLKRFYATCSAVVLPSSYEGFGLPYVEAVSYGSPIISSNIEPFQEQLRRYDYGDRSTICSQVETSDWKAAMQASLEKPLSPLTKDQIEAKLSLWSWDSAANRYLELMQMQ